MVADNRWWPIIVFLGGRCLQHQTVLNRIDSSIDELEAMKNLLKLLVITLILEESFAQGKCLVYVRGRA